MEHGNERTLDGIENKRRALESLGIGMRVAMPGIIQSVDYEKQTCTVQPAIREMLNQEGNIVHDTLPLLVDVPFFVYSGGGYCLTLPVSENDECLVVFGDECIDGWWQNGGVQNQVERRRHDLSDGFAIVGFRSQQKKLSNYSGNTAQIRTESGSSYIEISDSGINIMSSNTTIDGVSFKGHMHSGVESGGSNTGGVVI
ncbi:Gp138 family membrane-puncturing spike protein [Megasphaera sueciensis]|uniref:Gp138 family membrane-puncturing spike protein n=1 Tax=Megasphaera sueciensis TaxID=349094 RepID=UPI003D07F672